ncbi:MAG: MotA/TolQ/ExbB proton channel family protein [Bacteroidales bacterium]|nr:MotA/TolQ/ExbB proton channel family protein [Bacteroidales bacterium]
MTNLFVEGGLAGMIAITVLLICLFLAAWKAPKWVKEIGLGALVVGIFWSLRGLSQMLDVLQMIGDVSPAVICGGLKVTLISTSYGLIVYFISLIIRVIQKPRI